LPGDGMGAASSCGDLMGASEAFASFTHDFGRSARRLDVCEQAIADTRDNAFHQR
jgi:hypothetical protein